MIPMHPEVVAGDPRTLRWVVPPGTLPVVGEAQHIPGPLGELLADGTLCSIAIQPDGVYTTLAATGWAALGPQVRTALQASLSRPEEWCARPRTGADAHPTADRSDRSASVPADRSRPVASVPADPSGRIRSDDEIATAAEAVLAGAAGDYLRSHGGSAEVAGVSDGVVHLRLRGACAGCPAAAMTLHTHLRDALCREVPGIRDVVQARSRPLTRRLPPLLGGGARSS